MQLTYCLNNTLVSGFSLIRKYYTTANSDRWLGGVYISRQSDTCQAIWNGYSNTTYYKQQMCLLNSRETVCYLKLFIHLNSKLEYTADDIVAEHCGKHKFRTCVSSLTLRKDTLALRHSSFATIWVRTQKEIKKEREVGDNEAGVEKQEHRTKICPN